MTPSRVVSAALLTLLGVSRAVATSPQSAFGPAIVDRTAADKVTVRTVRLEKPLRIDGRLDEEVYAALEAISDFIQQEPHEGAPATEKVGYVRRTDFRRSFGQARFSPRPKQSKRIRKLTWQGSLDYVTDAPGVAVQNREAGGLFRIDFHTSDQLMFDYSREYELLPATFTISPGVFVPPGGYSYETSRVSYLLGQQRKVSGRLSASTGTLYGGTKSEVTYTGRWGVMPQFSMEPGVTLDWVHLPYGDFTERLISSRFTVTPSARMLISALVQYNAGANSLTSSIRLRWEYTGGSELFVVYSDGRNTLASGFPALQNRTFAIKATRLVRF